MPAYPPPWVEAPTRSGRYVGKSPPGSAQFSQAGLRGQNDLLQERPGVDISL